MQEKIPEGEKPKMLFTSDFTLIGKVRGKAGKLETKTLRE
jgi:hypothetical protein